MTDEIKVKYKKMGGGSFRTKEGKIIKPNQIFDAFPSDIPTAFKDTIIRQDGTTNADIKREEKEEEVEVVTAEYRLQGKGRGWYDVYRGDKKISEKSMREDAAKKFIEDAGGKPKAEDLENETNDLDNDD